MDYNYNKRDDNFTPFKKYTFPAGEIGGEIRLSIPLTATNADVRAAAEMINVLASNWKGLNE